MNNSCNGSDVSAKVPAKRSESSLRKIRPLVKPIEIPQPPPTTFDLFCEEEKQTWSKAYRQSMFGSCPGNKSQFGNRLKDHVHLALAFRWNSLAQKERTRFENRAKEHYEFYQQEVVRYKYMAGQLNPLYRYAVAKNGTRLHSINWSQQMVSHSPSFSNTTKRPYSTPSKANMLLQPSIGIKHAPMGPPPPILSPKLVSSSLSSPLMMANVKLPSTQSSFHFAWSVVNSLDQGISSLLKDTSGNRATIKSDTISQA